MNRLKKAIEENEFILTAELGPPKGVDLTRFIEKGKQLAPYFHGINVTDNQSSVMRLSSLAACVHLLRLGATPVLQMTCRDRNRLAIQADLLGAWSLGIENVLALTGDHPRFGDHPQAKAVYDIDSVQLIAAVKGLNEGRDMAGKQLKGSPGFIIGGAVSPMADPIEPELAKFEKKVAAGAVFFQTQAIFEPEKMESFMTHARKHNVRIIAGVLVLKSQRMVDFINENVPGLDIPPHIARAIANAANPEEEGIHIAARLSSELAELADGVHLMAIGNEQRVVEVAAEAGLIR